MKNAFSAGLNLQTNYRFKLISQMWITTQETSPLSIAPNPTRPKSYTARNSPEDYPSWPYKAVIEEYDGNVLDPIFQNL